MDFLIANLSAWDERNTDYWIDVGYDLEYEYRFMNKHYILNTYLVDDIMKVPMAKRCVYIIIHYYIYHYFVILVSSI